MLDLPAVDAAAFRDCMGRFATGVAVVTTRTPGGERLGMTVNSIASVSLDPPMVLFCLDRGALSLDGFLAAGCFAVNVLRDDQAALSRRFAARLGDKWTGVATATGRTGCPLLEGALARIECRTAATHEGGDHVVFLGEVVATDVAAEGAPLLFYRGGYGRFLAAAPADETGARGRTEKGG